MKICGAAILMVALLFTIEASAAASAAGQAQRMVLSGVVPGQGGDTPVLERFVRWLAEASDYPLEVAHVDSYQALSETLRTRPASLAWTCGQPFVEDRADGQRLVAVPLYKGKPTYHSLVITRRGRSEKSLKDFKNKVVAYSDPRSNSGLLAPKYVLHRQGIAMELYFRLLLHTGRHENSIVAVLNGLADVANVDEYVWDEYLKRYPSAAEKLVVLERNGPYPFTPIVAGSMVPEPAIRAIRQALLTMHRDVRGAGILRQLGLDGFVEKPDTFYRPIAEMLETLR